MDSTDIGMIISLVVLVLFSGFFSSAETALSCANKIRLRALEEDGNKRAASVLKILDDYPKMLSTVLVGNNLVNIGASSLATAFTIKRFGSGFIGACTGILTFVVLIFGEIVPKTVAKNKADQVAMSYAGIIRFLMTVLTPVVFLVDGFAGAVTKLLRFDKEAQEQSITEEELRTFVDVSHEEGVLERDEHTLISNVMDFADSLAEEIMIPRIDVASLPDDASLQDIRELFEKTQYTRFPVYHETPDHIIGMIHMKDWLFAELKEYYRADRMLREVYYTYEKKKTSDLFVEMKEKAASMAVVLDEYSSAVGIITMEDLLEELVGEIRDEYDKDEEEQIRKVAEGAYLILAGMKLDDINDALGLSLESEDYDSIGGMMMGILDRLPANKETVTLENGISLQAKGVYRNRIRKVLLRVPVENMQ